MGRALLRGPGWIAGAALLLGLLLGPGLRLPAQAPAAPGAGAQAQAEPQAQTEPPLAGPQPQVQQGAEGEPYRLQVGARLVTVTTLVRNRHGGPVKDLSEKDFTLKEDGKTVPIRYFDVDNNLPLTIGLLVDTSLSEKKFAEEQRKASRKFLHEMITRPQDRAFLERFDWHALILQSLTPDLRSLDIGLGGLLDNPGEDQPAGTVLWDAILATSDQIVSKEPGRRALIVMTDGEDVGSHASLRDAIGVSQLYDVPIYTILFTEKNAGFTGQMDPTLRGAMGTAPGPAAMEELSQRSGGRAFAEAQMPLDQIFQAIEEDLRSEYRLGFTPVKAPVGTKHTLQVKVARRGVDVDTRSAYYTQP
jgi:VWFA-related protein